MTALKPPESNQWWQLPAVWWLWLGLAWLLWGVYAWFSYSLTAPNLVLSTWSPFWEFQTWIWKTFFNNRPLLTQSYASLLSLIWVHYAVGAWLWWQTAQSKTELGFKLGWVALAASLPMLLANNNLSYDLFNYIFNAKMVVAYQANPHFQVALDFPDDPWLRFMHNTHTPAPYAYGWTALSLVPYTLGLGKFLLTWWAFRAWSWLSLLGLAWAYWRWRTQLSNWGVWLVLTNPLMITEIIGNAHNDLWSTVPAVVSLAWLAKTSSAAPSQTRWRQWLGSALLLAVSVSIKWVTLVIVPIWIGLWLSQLGRWPKSWQSKIVLVAEWWPAGAALTLLVPLLTLRSQQFHPWYWTWCLVWLPWLLAVAGKTHQPHWVRWISGFLATGLVSLAISSSYRYLPFLWANTFEGSILWQQKMITWAGGGVAVVILGLLVWLKARHSR